LLCGKVPDAVKSMYKCISKQPASNEAVEVVAASAVDVVDNTADAATAADDGAVPASDADSLQHSQRQVCHCIDMAVYRIYSRISHPAYKPTPIPTAKNLAKISDSHISR